MPAATGEQIANDRQEFVEIERLLEVHVGAGVEASDAVLHQRAGRQHHDRHVVALRPDCLADGVATHAWQHQVEHDQIDRDVFARGRCRQGRGCRRIRRLANHGQSGLPVAGNRHPEALSLEVVLDADGEMLFVFDDEDVRHGVPAAVPRPEKPPGKTGPYATAPTR